MAIFKHQDRPILADYGVDYFSVQDTPQGIKAFVKMLNGKSRRLTIPEPVSSHTGWLLKVAKELV